MRTIPLTTLMLTLAACTTPPSMYADDAVEPGTASLDAANDRAASSDSAPSPDDVTEEPSSPDAVASMDSAFHQDAADATAVDSEFHQDAADIATVLDADATAVDSEFHQDAADIATVLDAVAASDSSPDGVTPPWIAGPLVFSPLPPRREQLPLPGGGQGDPVFTSNNPEIFQGDGLLFGTGRASPTRGGARFPMSRFGVYLHHVNQSGSMKFVSLIVTNPNTTSVTVSARGSGYNQTETGGLGLGSSPDFRVSDEWIRSLPTTVIPPTSLAPSRPLLIWQKSVNNNAEIDGRFRIDASAPVLAYLVVTSSPDLNEVIRQSLVDAPGIIARSGTPPPPFGREAGVYEFDTWRGSIAVDVPAAPTRARLGWMVNTATGSGHTQVQAFRALVSYNDSARESVGMYGNVYDLDITLRCPARDGAFCRVRLVFLSHLTAMLSRYWDGVALVDGIRTIIRHTPANPATTLGEYTLSAGTSRTVRFRAMVPGLTSIPQALYAETF